MRCIFYGACHLVAACGALNTTTAAGSAATPTSPLPSRAPKTPSTVKVNETAAKVEVVKPSAPTGQTRRSQTPPPGFGDVSGVCSGLSDLFGRSLMLRKI